MTIAGSEFNLPPWMDESLSPQVIPLERDKPEYPPRFGHISEQSVQNLFFPDGRPTLGAVGRSPEELEEIRRDYIYKGDISPERTDPPEVWARWYKVMEEKRALDSEKGGADAGRQSSDLSEIPVAGAQYAMAPKSPFERGDRPGRPSGEGGGGGVAPQPYKEVGEPVAATRRGSITKEGLKVYDRELGRVRKGETERNEEAVRPGQLGRIPEDMRSPRQQRNIERREEEELRRELNRRPKSEPKPKGEPGGYQVKETVESAAVKTKEGKIIEGPTHFNIIEKMTDKQIDRAVEGFTTSSGRFISREEAMSMVKRNKQLVPKSRRDFLIAEDLIPTK